MKYAIAAVIGVLAGCTSSDELVVKLDSGSVRGARADGIRSFLGVPYAAPPIGELRWKQPQAVTPWTGVQDALDYGSECPQSFLSASDDEDCLYLNVWAPSGAHKLPVMVWIHGGAFIGGSGNDKWYAGPPLAKRGLIVVTLNYRLGAFGFLSHPALDVDDPAYPTSGNYGLEDQRAVLGWVQRNIAAFGGDPTQVTLFGESAGGFSTCVQYLSPRTNGMFAAAISESGLCGAEIVAPGHATADSLGLDLGTQLGCPGSGASALACMRALDTDKILAATGLPPVMSQDQGGPFYQTTVLGSQLPNVDGYVIGSSLRDAFAAGVYSPRPFLLGTNKDEGTLFHAPIYALAITDEAHYRVALGTRFGSANVDAIEAKYPPASFATPNDALAAVTGDAFFVCPARAAARGAALAGATVFRYSFEQPLSDPFAPGLGVFHSSELPFVFGNDTFPLGHIGDATPVADAMQTYWTAFAKQSDPNDASVAAWPAYDAATDPYLTIDGAPHASSALKSSLCDFWDALPPP